MNLTRRTRSPRLAGLVAMAALVATTAAAEAQHFPDEDALLEIIRSRVDEGRATGIVLGVIEADGTRTVVAYGDAGPGAQPLSAESVFEIGSISKTFSGVLLAEMAERGEVSMEAPIQAHAHEGVEIPSRGGREINFIDLATHRSSLPRLPTNMRPADGANPYADYTVDQLHEFLNGHTLRRDIGLQYEYSNLATGLLGHLLAKTAGMSYEEAIRERILTPLGMDMTGIDLTDEMSEQLAIGHSEGRPVSNWDIPTLAGAGAIRSNMNDMLTYIEANIHPSDNTLGRAMETSHVPLLEAGGGNDVALNWHVLTLGDRQIVWHNGGTGGYRTWAGFDPDLDVGVVVLTNSNEGADDIGYHLVNDGMPLVSADEAAGDRVEIELDRSVLERYVGVYELNRDLKFTIELEEVGLTVQLTGQPSFRIYPESETRFFLKVVEAQISFVVEDGEVQALILHQGGANQRARKTS